MNFIISNSTVRVDIYERNKKIRNDLTIYY